MQRFVDVTDAAQEAGFSCRVLMSKEVWQSCCKWTEEDNARQCYQDQDARVWDVLFVPAVKLKMANADGLTERNLLKDDGLTYQIYCVLHGCGEDASLIYLKVAPAKLEASKPGLIISFPWQRQLDADEQGRQEENSALKAEINKALDKVSPAIKEILRRASKKKQ